MRTGILVSGEGTNLQALLDATQRGELPIRIVALGSDQKGAAALSRARVQGIPVAIFSLEDYENRQRQEEGVLAWALAQKLDLVLLAGYRRILSADFLRQVNCPVLNIHPSLLPAFPGLNAQRQALNYGVKISGCTVHFVEEGLDSGPIILQEAVPVLAGDTEELLIERILQVEHRLYPEAVRLVASGRVERRGRKCIIKS